MPTTVTSPSGTSYHLWQLPDLSSPEPAEAIKFNRLTNDLSNGYTSQVLFGSNTGLRTFTLKLPTLAHGDVMANTVTGINGDTLTREQYVWELYCECMVSGDPFVFQSSRNNQYYLVRFLDEELTYERMKVKIYGSGIKLQQVRESGETVFAVDNMRSPRVNTWVKNGSGTDLSGNGNTFTAAGDVTTETFTVLDGWRFNASTNTGKVTQSSAATFYDIFILMRCREVTFGQTSGVLTGTTSTPILVGINGGTTFANQTFISGDQYEYRLNDVQYGQGAQAAPMNNVWGLVHVHFGAGKTFTPQLGQDRNVGVTTKAEIDVHEIVMFTTYLPHSARREVVEYLMIKRGILNG